MNSTVIMNMNMTMLQLFILFLHLPCFIFDSHSELPKCDLTTTTIHRRTQMHGSLHEALIRKSKISETI